MHNYPSLRTERLIINQVQLKDIPKIVEHAGHKKVSDTTLNIPYPYASEDAENWINITQQGFSEGNQFAFAVRLPSNLDFIGSVGLKINQRFNRAELGYWIGFPFWGKGYATEAAQAMLKFGFEQLNLNKIYAVHTTENPNSGKVMQKNGMVQEGELVDHYKKGNRYYTVIQYRMTKSEYQANF